MEKLFILAAFLLLFMTGCSSKVKSVYSEPSAPQSYPDTQGSYSPVVNQKDYQHPTMRPYEIRGIKYYPTVVKVGDILHGNASWYGPDFHGKSTSNGETYNMHDMTAAHKTLPMNTIVKIGRASCRERV